MHQPSVDSKKLRALSLRFTERSKNDPISFPSSFISGPSAFPRIQLEHRVAVATGHFEDQTLDESEPIETKRCLVLQDSAQISSVTMIVAVFDSIIPLKHNVASLW